MALGEAVFHQQAAAVRPQPQQPQLIGQGGGGTAQQGGGLLLGGAGLPEIGGDGGGLLKIVEVLPLDVFDEGQEGGFLLLRLDADAGNGFQPRQLGRPEAALACHQFPALRRLADRQGLEDAVAADGVRQFRQGLGVKGPPGLAGVGGDVLYGKEKHLRVQHIRAPPDDWAILPLLGPF